jgi:putative transposase
VHLLVTPHESDSLARAIGRTHWLYSQYLNRFHKRSGHLWQNRFFSCAVDGEHLLHSACYIERNPVRARIVRLAWRYPWSSAAAHVGEADRSGLLQLARWKVRFPPKEWMKNLQQPQDEKLILRMERSLHTGRPLASDSVLSKLEKRCGRRLRPLPIGRPRRSRNR